jgi:hypothetical protein
LDLDLSAPTCIRRGAKKKGRKPKGGKRSASVTNRKWQDLWATAFSWAEKYYEEDGLVLSVKCLVCTRILDCPKTLSLKRDNLNKHAGWYKAAEDMPSRGVKAGEWFRDKENGHFKNEGLFAGLTKATVLEQLKRPVELNWTKKKAQFIIVLFLLLNGRPMIDFPAYKDLFNFLNVPFVPYKHWSVSSGWGIVECLGEVVDHCIQKALAECSFFSLTCDEVTIVDNQIWISVHVYVVKNDYFRMPYLLALERVEGGTCSNNLTKLITSFLKENGGLSREDI